MAKLLGKHGLPQHAVAAIQSVLRAYPGVKKAILYGSRAMGNYRQGSDIDLCLEGESLALKDLLMIENQLDDLLLPWKIDLSLKHYIDNPNLLNHINRVGVKFK